MSTVTVKGRKVTVTRSQQKHYEDLVRIGVDDTQALQMATGEYRDNVTVKR